MEIYVSRDALQTNIGYIELPSVGYDLSCTSLFLRVHLLAILTMSCYRFLYITMACNGLQRLLRLDKLGT